MPSRDSVLAKPNYSFEKRQRDLEKKRKQDEKRQKKAAGKKPGDDDGDLAESVENEQDAANLAGSPD